jgi:hypothetical protein
MLRSICLCLLVGTSASRILVANAQLPKQNAQSSDKEYTTMREVKGNATNGLQPCIDFNASSNGWDIDISMLARADFSERTWLKVTNHVGSKLELWQTNSAPVFSTNADIWAAFHLPEQTTASEIIRHSFIRPDRRAYQWWRAGRPVSEGELDYTANFKLETAFDIFPTNDYVLQITPLIYKVETNEVTAHLVEFPPIKIKLMANGNVQKIDK